MSSELVALNNSWLSDTTASGLTGGLNCVSNTLHFSGDPYIWGNQWAPPVNYGWYYTYTGPAKPIRLTMAEVDRLRAAAKRDAKLKAVLAKFTDQIEVIVDLG